MFAWSGPVAAIGLPPPQCSARPRCLGPSDPDQAAAPDPASLWLVQSRGGGLPLVRGLGPINNQLAGTDTMIHVTREQDTGNGIGWRIKNMFPTIPVCQVSSFRDVWTVFILDTGVCDHSRICIPSNIRMRLINEDVTGGGRWDPTDSVCGSDQRVMFSKVNWIHAIDLNHLDDIRRAYWKGWSSLNY